MLSDSIIESYKKIIKKIKKSKLSDDKKRFYINEVNKILEEYKNNYSYLTKNDTESLNFLANLYDQENQIIELIDFKEKEQEELKKIDKSFINPEKRKLLMLYGEVYSESLYRITKNFNFNPEMDKRKNIEIAKTKRIVDIMVRKTVNPNVYEEILTGIKFPIYEKEYDDGLSYYTHRYIPKKPYYIKVSKADKRIMNKAEYDQLKAYVDKYADNIEEFREYLNSVINDAEQYYQDSYDKCHDEKTKIKSLLKKYK